MINLGTDVISDWSFEDGDIRIVKSRSNLGQALANRLNTYENVLAPFYNDYGSILFDYMGELNNPNIHEYIKIEVEDCIKKDKRVLSATCTVDKVSSDGVKCTLDIILVDGTDVDLDMIITQENTVVIN